MGDPKMVGKFVCIVGLIVAALLVGLPAAAFAVHGFDVSLWPDNVVRPAVWFSSWIDTYGFKPLNTYWHMLTGYTDALGPYGRTAFLCIFAAPASAILLAFWPRSGPRRDPNATYGDARWATRGERRQMRVGLEFGLDPNSGRPTRVTIESHIVSIAAPRTGKTSGLVIPNLLAPEHTSWFGPACVFDPKAEVFRAVAERRRALGRQVRCFDPLNIAGGEDRWNPLQTLDRNNILYLQRVARALLPQEAAGEQVYFRNRAAAAIVGAFLAAHTIGEATPAGVARLLANVDTFSKAMGPLQGLAAENAKAILSMDPKGRDAILSTAGQAFDWVADPRLQRATGSNTFELSELCGGETDLFIPIPAEDMEALAPLLRWILCDLFTIVRRRPPLDRIVCFIDEASTVFGGQFGEFLQAAGELPGHGLSFWSFWQTRSQITKAFGKDGAQTLLNTAEFITFSDVPLIDPDGRELLSRAIGNYTNLEEVTMTDKKVGTTSVSLRPTAVRLMTPEAIAHMSSRDLIILPNSKRYAKRALQIRKTVYDDPRLKGLTNNAAA
jgi:type IV secretion system protein VirD4